MAKASDLPEPTDPNDPTQQPTEEGNVDFSTFMPGSPIPGDPASGSSFSWADAFSDLPKDSNQGDSSQSPPLRFDAVSDKDLLRTAKLEDPGQRGPSGLTPDPTDADVIFPVEDDAAQPSAMPPLAQPVEQEISYLSSFEADKPFAGQTLPAEIPMAQAADLSDEVSLLPDEPPSPPQPSAMPELSAFASADPRLAEANDELFAVQPTTSDDSLWPGSSSIGQIPMPSAEPVEDDVPMANYGYAADASVVDDSEVSFGELDAGPMSGDNSSILGSLDMSEQMPEPQQIRRKTDHAERPFAQPTQPEIDVVQRRTDPGLEEDADDIGGIFDEIDTPGVGPSSEVDILPSGTLPPVAPPPPRAKMTRPQTHPSDQFDGSEIDLLSSELPSSIVPKQPADDSNMVNFDDSKIGVSESSDAIFGSDDDDLRTTKAADSILEDFDEGTPQVAKKPRMSQRPDSTFESAVPTSFTGLSPTGGFPAYTSPPAVTQPTSSGFTGAYEPAMTGAPAQPAEPEAEPSKRRGGRLMAWIGGGLLGLLAGIGLVAGPLATDTMPENIRYLLVPPDKIASAVKAKEGQPLIPPPIIKSKEKKQNPVDEAEQLLRVGKLSDALKAIETESKGKKVGDPKLLAIRGQLTWQNYLAEQRKANKTLEPNAKNVESARRDLTEASEKEPDAAYWLGQLEAMVGNLDLALKIYEDAITRFPNEAETFEDARDLLRSRMSVKRNEDNQDIPPPSPPKEQNAPADDLPLSMHDGECLGQLLLMTTCLGDLGSAGGNSTPAPPAKQYANAAKLIREAIELSNKDQVSAALNKLAQAKQLYLSTEPESAGRSREINNLMFVCDQLQEAFMGQQRLRKSLEDLKIDPRDPAKAINELSAKAKDAETYKKMIDDAQKSLDLAKVVEKERDSLKVDLAKTEKEREAIKQDLAKVEKEYKLAKDNLASAEAKLQELVEQSNKQIASLAGELKKAKAIAVDPDKATIKDVAEGIDRLIQLGDKDKGRELLEKLSTLQKQLNDEKSRADEAVKTAKLLADNRKAELAKAEKDLADAQAQAKKDLMDLETKLKVERADAVKAAIADKLKEIADLRARLGKESELVRAELGGKIISLEKDVAELKAYSTKLEQLLGSESRLKDASLGDKHFAVAYTRFFQGRYADAEKEAKQAIEIFAADARYYYFLGLAQYMQGRTKESEAALREAAELERMGRTSPADVSLSLERIQGPLRRYVYQFRP